MLRKAFLPARTEQSLYLKVVVFPLLCLRSRAASPGAFRGPTASYSLLWYTPVKISRKNCGHFLTSRILDVFSSRQLPSSEPLIN